MSLMGWTRKPPRPWPLCTDEIRDLEIGQLCWCHGPTTLPWVFAGIDLKSTKPFRGPVTVRAIGVPYKKGTAGVLVSAITKVRPHCTCSQCGNQHVPEWAYEDGAEMNEREIEFTTHYSSLWDYAEAMADQAVERFEWDERRRQRGLST